MGSTLLLVALTFYFYFVELSLLLPLLFLILGIYLYLMNKASLRLFLHLGFLLTLLFFTTHLIQQYASFSNLYIPLAAWPMLTMLLYNDLELSSMMSFIASSFVALLVGWNLHFMLIFFISGLFGAYVVADSRTRGRLIEAGLLVGLIQVIGALLIYQQLNMDVMMEYFKPLLLNGLIASIIVIPTLKIFESLFGVMSNFTLLELSDSTNQPLLKRMVIEAPGTYHHTLIVSNLAEAAAESIGAHGLLARVGAYYHDIGKLIKPEYFTENQMMSANVHDSLEPSMSRLVVLNHVKEGIELAKKNKLNHKIIDFIPQHHGTSLMHYFYQRALEESKEDIAEESYRYPGPKPQSRETAIVLLADSVEGATRALDEHTPVKIEEVVRKVVNNKFIDGQLDECTLTLKEIDGICKTFTRVLSAMYHGRVKYPEKKTNGNHVKKSPEEDSHPSAGNHSSHP